MPSLAVQTDPRARALSAALAATDWPEREQRPKPRGVHPQAAALRRHLQPFRSHPTTVYFQNALYANQDPLPLFTRALSGEAELSSHLRQFSETAGLDSYWAEHHAAWTEAVAEVETHIAGVDFASALLEACGVAPNEMIILPNLSFPTGLSFGINAAGKTYSLMPPRKAVGESPPWPFRDDRDHVLKLAINDFCLSVLDDFFDQHQGLLPEASAASYQLPMPFRAMHPTWPRQVAKLYTYGVTSVFLNHTEAGEGDALILYDSRTKNLPLLPKVVASVSNYLSSENHGTQSDLAEYLPKLAGEIEAWLAEA